MLSSWSNKAKWLAYLAATVAYGISFGEIWKHYLKDQFANLPEAIGTWALGIGLFVPMLILGSISVTYYNKSRDERRGTKGSQSQ